MTLDQQIVSIIITAPWILFKFFAAAFLLLHIAFSVILLRQTKLMITVIEAKISPTIYAISLFHFLFSLFAFIWSIIFL